MEDFTVEDILKATKGKLVKGDSGFIVKGISTDSRTLTEGDFFFALMGERFDGHNFVSQAVSRGAAGLVVSKDVGDFPVGNIILVEDTLQALGDTARSYRGKFDIPVIGITGSNGKTTTKDMAASILARRYSVLKNEGNLNNAIGMPLTLFRLSRMHEIAVLEMGISLPGEMQRLVEIAQPDVAVVTNVGPTHLEFLGSIDNVAVEKGVLVRSASSAVLNADDPRVAKMRVDVKGRSILFGLARYYPMGKDSSEYVLAEDVRQDQEGRPEFVLVTNEGKISIRLQSLGRHNVYNALAAASVGVLFCMCLDKIKEGLEFYEGVPMRMRKMVVGGAIIIDDTYNSNPASLKAAIDFLSETECKGKRIVVAGDMLELGERSEELHRVAGRFIAGHPVHTLITVGDKSAKLAESALSAGIPEDRVIVCKTNPEAISHLQKIIKEGDVILIKGSRGMKMEEIVKSVNSNW